MIIKRDPRAGLKALAGRIRPVGRCLEISVLDLNTKKHQCSKRYFCGFNYL